MRAFTPFLCCLRFGCGQVDTFSNALTRYSPATGQWEALAPCPEQHDHSETFVHGGKLWVVGGKGHWPELPPAAERPFIDMHYYRWLRWRACGCVPSYTPVGWGAGAGRMTGGRSGCVGASCLAGPESPLRVTQAGAARGRSTRPQLCTGRSLP